MTSCNNNKRVLSKRFCISSDLDGMCRREQSGKERKRKRKRRRKKKEVINVSKKKDNVESKYSVVTLS